MEAELKNLKSVLRSLVVSSPAQVDVRSLMRDYREMMGECIPLKKFGVNDPVSLLKTHFSDCFLFQGPQSNPVLTLIVPEALKHIDQFVRKQKVSSQVKQKGKRKSVNESSLNKSTRDTNLIVKTFQETNSNTTNQFATKVYHGTKQQYEKEKVDKRLTNVCYTKSENKNEMAANNTENFASKEVNNVQNQTCPQNALQNFFKKRTPMCDTDYCAQSEDSDKGNTLSSTSSSKKKQLEDVKKEIIGLILESPEGIWCTDLLRLYRERYHRELNFMRFGYTSILNVAAALDGCACRRVGDDWLLVDARTPPSERRPAPVPSRTRALRTTADPEDALPYIDFEADVFPEDCMHYLDSISHVSLDDVEAGCMLEVIVGEVYSPSHFWLIRLGDNYNIAMWNIMDEMNAYYKGEGKDRRLSLGAVRTGHYCSSCYCGDWHRSVIVKVIDSDTVKVRHVDYGTVETCSVSALRPLRREWARLPMQAVRARLAAVRPPAGGRSWPRASAARFLRVVEERPLIANVVAHDVQEEILEVLLIDTSTDEDVCIGQELVRSGHADPHAGVVTGTSECHLYPLFEALETGATPNFAEIHAYLSNGIALEYVDDYRRHVPPSVPLTLPLEIPADSLVTPPSPPPVFAPPPPPPPPPISKFEQVKITQPSPEHKTKISSPVPAIAPTIRHNPPTALVTPSLIPSSRPVTPVTPAPILMPPQLTSVPWPYTANYGTQRLAAPRVQAPTANESNVTLSASDCEVFTLLSQVNPAAAQRFMVEAIERARVYRVTSINGFVAAANVEAPPTRPGVFVPSAVPTGLYANILPPPGFDNHF